MRLQLSSCTQIAVLSTFVPQGEYDDSVDHEQAASWISLPALIFPRPETMAPKLVHSSTPICDASLLHSGARAHIRHSCESMQVRIGGSQLSRLSSMLKPWWKRSRDPAAESKAGASARVTDLLRWDFDSFAITDADDQICHLLVMFEHVRIRPLLGVFASECSQLLTNIQAGYAQDPDLLFKRYVCCIKPVLSITSRLTAAFNVQVLP